MQPPPIYEGLVALQPPPALPPPGDGGADIYKWSDLWALGQEFGPYVLVGLVGFLLLPMLVQLFVPHLFEWEEGGLTKGLRCCCCMWWRHRRDAYTQTKFSHLKYCETPTPEGIALSFLPSDPRHEKLSEFVHMWQLRSLPIAVAASCCGRQPSHFIAGRHSIAQTDTGATWSEANLVGGKTLESVAPVDGSTQTVGYAQVAKPEYMAPAEPPRREVMTQSQNDGLDAAGLRAMAIDAISKARETSSTGRGGETNPSELQPPNAVLGPQQELGGKWDTLSGNKSAMVRAAAMIRAGRLAASSGDNGSTGQWDEQSDRKQYYARDLEGDSGNYYAHFGSLPSKSVQQKEESKATASPSWLAALKGKGKMVYHDTDQVGPSSSSSNSQLGVPKSSATPMQQLEAECQADIDKHDYDGAARLKLLQARPPSSAVMLQNVTQPHTPPKLGDTAKEDAYKQWESEGMSRDVLDMVFNYNHGSHRRKGSRSGAPPNAGEMQRREEEDDDVDEREYDTTARLKLLQARPPSSAVMLQQIAQPHMPPVLEEKAKEDAYTEWESSGMSKNILDLVYNWKPTNRKVHPGAGNQWDPDEYIEERRRLPSEIV